MVSKRNIDTVDESHNDFAPERKRAKSGFAVGPDNLPDGTWKRKVLKIKKGLIQKAKIKKSYAKIKAQEPPIVRPTNEDGLSGGGDGLPAVNLNMHPERQAILSAPDDSTLNQGQTHAASHRQPHRKPGYFEKEISLAERKIAETEARRQEYDRQQKERKQRMEERDRVRRAMAKARSGGRNGQRKLGRESKILLDKVRRLVDED